MELEQALKEKGLNPLVLKNPRGKAVVVPELGGRIISVVVDGRECLWRDPRLAENLQGLGWNTGGQRTWIAPEHSDLSLYFDTHGQWRCPAGMDPGAYGLLERGQSGVVHLTNTFSYPFRQTPVGFHVGRWVSLPDHRIIAAGISPRTGRHEEGLILRVDQAVRYYGWNKGSLCIGAWAILQLPAPGVAIILTNPEVTDVPRFHDDFFNPILGEWVILGKGLAAFRLTGTSQYKLGFSARLFPIMAFVEYLHRDPASGFWLLVRQTIVVPPNARYMESPGVIPSAAGDAVQFYSHFSADAFTYVEIEGHGPAACTDGEDSILAVEYEFFWYTSEDLVRNLAVQGLEDMAAFIKE